MKQHILIILVLLLLFACAQPSVKEPDAMDTADTNREDTAREEGIDTPPEDIISESKPLLSIDADTQKLIDTARSKVKSYSFYYDDPGNNPQHNQYFIIGDKAKVKLFAPDLYTKETNYDTVYYNTGTKETVGRCEARDQRRCPDPAKRFEAAYDSAAIMAPLDWLDAIESATMTQRSESIGSRKGIVITFTSKKGSGEMWLDNFFGAPLKVTLNGENPLIWEFKDIAFNTLNDKDVAEP